MILKKIGTLACAIVAPAFFSASATTAMPLNAPIINAESAVELVGHHSVAKKGFHYRYGKPYYGKYRGYSYKRSGYRFYKGYYFPAKAFGGGSYGGVSKHVAWCEGRYKTYRRSDNSYIYKPGYRRKCRSPYS